MNVSEAVSKRRAVKWYDAEHKMPEDTFRTLMEHALLAARDGVVAEVLVAEGDQVVAGAALVRLEDEEEAAA